MEQMDDVSEDSLDIFGSVWMDVLGMSTAADNWSVCLSLVEFLSLDVLTQLDVLLEHPSVSFRALGPLLSDEPCVWMFLQN